MKKEETPLLKKHHKIMIGSLSSLFILLLITNSIFLYILFVELNNNVKEINSKILELQADTQNKISGLTENIVQTNKELKSLGSQIGSIDEEISLLKASTSEDFSGIIEDAVKSVVTIRTDVGQGTGFIITEDGYLVTNAHVLSGGREVEAITYEQDIIEAEFIGYESNLDIALLKIDGTYNRLTLENSNKVQVGEKVIVIGNPLGLQFSVSEGIVSAIHRAGLGGLEAYIQTDAALNPGNSGGPLINKEGKVIGINNFKVGAGENLGFALESNYIKEAVNNIAEKALNQTLI
ncbi:MAG TPA: trypsin-like peptidase domain-containing protein [Candidatus Nanoarchaeia archaeon]|nr:trypsin-like peptidase domain-containing protein [Candidatus Nanoarchaeia archaeon]